MHLSTKILLYHSSLHFRGGSSTARHKDFYSTDLGLFSQIDMVINREEAQAKNIVKQIKYIRSGKEDKNTQTYTLKIIIIIVSVIL